MAGLRPLSALKDEDFRRISFVGRCEQNQWATTRDNKLEIMMSAEPGESCEARLHFREPQRLERTWQASSLWSGVPAPNNAWPSNSSAPEKAIGRQPRAHPALHASRTNGPPTPCTFRDIRKGSPDKSISEIRFIAMSETGRSAPSLFIGDIAFSSEAADAAAAARRRRQHAVAPDIPLERQMVCVSANELSSLQTPPRIVAMTISAEFKRLGGMLLAQARTLSKTSARSGRRVPGVGSHGPVADPAQKSVDRLARVPSV